MERQKLENLQNAAQKERENQDRTAKIKEMFTRSKSTAKKPSDSVKDADPSKPKPEADNGSSNGEEGSTNPRK